MAVYWVVRTLAELQRIFVIWGSFWDNGKENGNYRDYRGNIGIIIGVYNGVILGKWKLLFRFRV